MTTATQERAERIRKAVVFDGESRATVAAREGVSVATVGRVLRETTDAMIDKAKVNGKKGKPKAEPKPKPEPVAAPSRLAAEREQIDAERVLAFNPAWTEEARASLTEELGRIENATYWLPPSRTYVRVEGADGRLAMAVEKSRAIIGDRRVSLPTTRGGDR
jgi:transposase